MMLPVMIIVGTWYKPKESFEMRVPTIIEAKFTIAGFSPTSSSIRGDILSAQSHFLSIEIS